MKLTKRDFLRFIGAGGAAVAGATGVEAAASNQTRYPAGGPIEFDITSRPPSHVPPNTLDLIDTILYDRFTLKPGQTIPDRFHVFNTPIGQVCPISGVLKHYLHTNMHMGNMLPAPQSFWLRKLHIMLSPESDPKALRAIGRYAWQLNLCQKVYDYGVIAYDGSRRWVEDYTEAPIEETRETRSYPTTGGLFIPSVMYFDFAAYSDSHYTLDLDGGELDVMFVMEGVLARPIQ